jgi:serine/threonine protein phosphatase PrpC
MARDLDGHARLVLCSDGLWTYFAAAEALADAADAARGASGDEPTVAEVARVLVDQALARGGQDNVTVAVCDVGAPPPRAAARP